MNSTQRKQREAAQRRRVQTVVNKISQTINSINEDLLALEGQLEFHKQPRQRMIPLLAEFAKEYRSQGDHLNPRFEDPERPENQGEIWHAVYYREQVAGFVCLNNYGNHIDIIYVKPEFRGMGLSSYVYRWAMTQGADSISLTLHRVLRNCEYWFALGFRSIESCEPDNMFSQSNELVVLYCAKVGMLLSRDNLKQFISKSRKQRSKSINNIVNKLIAKI